MKISTILDFIDNGHMALPEFQRGYVWNRDQVRALMDSLYRRHPVGSLLVWGTQSEGAHHRGDGQLAPGVVKLLLDGQQRMTSVYGIVRGGPPQFFDGNAKSFTGLYFHLEREEFAFYSPIKMADDPLWVDVSALMQRGYDGLGEIAEKAGHRFFGKMNQLLGIRDIEIHIEEVTGADKNIDVVVDIFNRVNSGGTKLSKGDLALAKVCADWPDARERMKVSLKKWNDSGYAFSLDWLLRNVNTIVTGEARFSHLHDVPAEKVQDGLGRAERAVDTLLNLVGGRLGLDHDRVLFGRYAFPVMAHYLDRRGQHLEDASERDLLLFWYIQSAMWGRFSGTTESMIDKDLEALVNLDGGLQRLIAELQLWRGSLRVSPGHFGGWSLGARFYPVLYMLTRVGEAKDWGTGLPLKSHMLGKMSQLEVHHIFPKAVLYDHEFGRAQVNAVANFCFLTKDTNLQIGASRPVEYFPEVEERLPGVLESQWIPMDPELWNVENYLDFLEARKELLAAATNAFLDELTHGAVQLHAHEEVAEEIIVAEQPLEVAAAVLGSIDSEEEEEALEELNRWVVELGLPAGTTSFELADPESGQPVAIFDLAWPQGLQTGYSQPVAVLLNEPPAVLQIANTHGFRHFTSVDAFKRYVSAEVVGENGMSQAVLA